MRYILLILTLFITFNAQAECIGPIIMGQCEGTTTNYSTDTSPQSQYKYNLNNIGDRIRYGNDAGAQIQDNTTIDINNDIRCSSGGFCGAGKY